MWRNKVYIREGDYYSVRNELGVTSNDITPWDWEKEDNSWIRNFKVKNA